MLKKKTGPGPKPKAPIRRNAAGPSSQGPARQPSKTPASSSASQQPVPTSESSETPAPQAVTTTTPSSSQVVPTTVVADAQSTVGASQNPVPVPNEPTDSQATVTANVPKDASDEVPSGISASIASTAPEPPAIADRSAERTTSVTTSQTTSATPSSRTDTEVHPSQPAESAITNPSDGPRPPTRPTRKAAPQPRVPLPTAAPNAPAQLPEPFTSTSRDQAPTPVSTTSQPTEPVPPDATAVLPQAQVPQAATPPPDSQSNIQQSIEVTGDAETIEATAPAPKPKRAPRKRKPAAEAVEAAEGDEAAPPAPKRTRKKKAPAQAPEGENQAENQVDDQTENQTEGEGNQQPASTSRRPRASRARSTQSGGEGAEAGTNTKKGGFRHRSPTPEDAEEQKVDQSQVTMGDLVKDLRIGKKFSRHDELLERQRMKKLKSKMGGGGVPGLDADGSGSAAGSKAGTPAPAGEANGESSSSATAPPPTRALTEGAPQFQIIDGQIVVNQSTLQFDRHAAAAREAGEMEEEVEDDFTHHTTSNTYLRRAQKPNHWTTLETETFYHGLRMFGTDFALLCKMFPGKNRRHVKLKFNREERAHPAKVNAALVGKKTVGIDLEEYKSHTGKEYKSVDEIEAEQRRVEEEFEAEQRRIDEEAAAEAERRKEELFGKKDEEVAVKKGRGRGKRKKDAGGMGF